MRFFCFALWLCLPSLNQAVACEIALKDRPVSLAAYVENGLKCLETPPQGILFSVAIEEALADKINAARLDAGLQPLTLRAAMLPAARFHALDMHANDYFSHYAPRYTAFGREPHNRLSAYDRKLVFRVSRENLAMLKFTGNLPDAPANLLHQSLMDSPTHRANILAEDITHLAIGVSISDGAIYAAQVFAEPAGYLDKAVPLQLMPGDRLDNKANFSGYDLQGLALSNETAGSVRLISGIIPAGLKGNAALRFPSHTKGTARRAISLIGPWISIIAPSEAFYNFSGPESVFEG